LLGVGREGESGDGRESDLLEHVGLLMS
jgi:hypothetical protein